MGRFETDDKTFKSMFTDDSVVFEIPVNQRKYSWNKEQLEEFWEDISKTFGVKSSKHYLGVISLVDKDNDGVDDIKKYEVVDGQQRIITTILLIAALRDVYVALNDIEKAEKIQEKYLLATTTRKTFNKLISCKVDSYTFDSLVNINCGEGNKIKIVDNVKIKLDKKGGRKLPHQLQEYVNKNLESAYEYFFNNIVEEYFEKMDDGDKEEYLLEIEECLAKIEIIQVISTNISNIYLFFDSLNNRGLQLNKMDIIRNNFFNVIAKKFPGSMEYFADLWDNLVILLDNYDTSKFLKYYFMCSQSKIFSSKDLPSRYDEYFTNIANLEEMKIEVRKIIDYAQIYITLFDKTEELQSDKNYIKNIKRINNLGQQACHSFLMDYFYFITDEERRSNITHLVECMTYKRIICNTPTKQLDIIFKSIIDSKEVENDKYIYNDSVITQKIIANTPTDDIFESAFKTKIWNKDNITYYTLSQIEMVMSKKDFVENDFNKFKNKIQLDFITPEQTASNNKIFNLIGNITLIEDEIFSYIKDSLFETKRLSEYYGKSKFELIKQIINNYIKWDINSINDRTNLLGKISLDIWYIS